MADDNEQETPAGTPGGGPPPAPDPELQRLKQEKDRALARQAIADANQATLKALLPDPSSKPLAGTTDLGDKAGYVAELVAYSALDHLGAAIAASVWPELAAEPDTARVLLVEDRALVLADWPYLVVREQLDQFLDTFRALDSQLTSQLDAAGQASTEEGDRPPAGGLLETPSAKPYGLLPFLGLGPAGVAMGAVKAAPALLGAAADVVGMLKTDYKVVDRDVQFSWSSLAAAVADHLLDHSRGSGRENRPQIIVEGFELVPETRLFRDFQTAQDLRRDVEERQQQLTSLTNPPKPADADPVAVAGTALDAFVKAVTLAPDKGVPPIIAAALRERLHTTEEAGSAPPVKLVLFVSVDSKGAEAVNQTGLFHESGRVAFLGGCHGSWLLLRLPDNVVVKAGSISKLTHVVYDLKEGCLLQAQRRQSAAPEQFSDTTTL